MNEKGKIILRKNGPIFQYTTIRLRNQFGESPNPYDTSLTHGKLKNYHRREEIHEYKIINCKKKENYWEFTNNDLKGWRVDNGLEVEAIFIDDKVEIKCLLD